MRINEIDENIMAAIHFSMVDREPSWEFYRSFLAVLREGSLSGAARALAPTQPTIGRHVDALEAALELALFTRSPQGLVATEAAAELRPPRPWKRAHGLFCAPPPGRPVRCAEWCA